MTHSRRIGASMAAFVFACFHPTARAVEFERIVIDDQFPGGCQVEVADVNGDKRPDVIAVGGGTCAWYENPSWKKRIVSGPGQTPGIVSSATADLNGDGKAEIAIAYEFSAKDPAKGKLLLASQGNTPDTPWKLELVNGAPSTHRLRWMAFGLRSGPQGGSFVKEGEGKPWQRQLVGASHLGMPSPTVPSPTGSAHLQLFSVAELQKLPSPEGFGVGGGVGGHGGFLGGLGGAIVGIPPIIIKSKDGSRTMVLIESKDGVIAVGHVSQVVDMGVRLLHEIEVGSFDELGLGAVLGASDVGVTRTFIYAIMGVPIYQTQVLVSGAPGAAPKSGCREVRLGRLKDGRRFLATVEPAEGTEVARYLSTSLKPLGFGRRSVIEMSSGDGHALWVADVDGDGDDELFAANWAGTPKLLVFDFDGETWLHSLVDPHIDAQGLRSGDLDGDGTPDLVAIGGATHNVVWYRSRLRRGPR